MSAPATWHLLLDYDRPQDMPGTGRDAVDGYVVRVGKWHAVIRKRLARAGYIVDTALLERSTNGWHGRVRLDVPPRSPMEVVALQAMLGSDPSRESCNIQRARELERHDHRESVARLVSDIEADTQSGAHAVRLERYARRLLRSWEDSASPWSFFRERYNTLYKPNPRRKRTDGTSKSTG